MVINEKVIFFIEQNYFTFVWAEFHFNPIKF